MKIGIDARLMLETGIGRYTRNLLRELGKIDEKNHYIVYLGKHASVSYKPPNPRFEKRIVNVRWHTFVEQVVMLVTFFRDDLDLLLVPYFNVPIFYPKRFIVTIHDLTVLHLPTGKATKLPYIFYKLKLIGYKIVLFFALKKAEKIIAVSNTTKKEIQDHYHIPDDKIRVIYEGIDEGIMKPIRSSLRVIGSPYFLYVGNAYPHKNLEHMLLGFQDFLHTYPKYKDTRLVIVGKHDYFYTQVMKFSKGLGVSDRIDFLGEVHDAELAALYAHAYAYVFPSLMEGFGLGGIEALYFHCPLICSDIPVFREIYGDIPYYIDPKDAKSFVPAMETMARDGKHFLNRHTEDIKELLDAYTWEKTGKETLSVIQEANRVTKPL